MAVNQNYQAEVGIKFNDTKLNKQLQSLNGKTISLNVKVQGGLGNLNKALKDTNKLLSESKSLLGQVGTASKNLDKNVKGLESSTNKLNKGMNSTTKNTKNAADAFNHTANHGKTLSKLFTDITKKVSAFGLVTQGILLLKQAMQEAVSIAVQYDEAITGFTKVSDLSGEALDKYTQKLREMGKEVFRTGTEMIQSATIFKQAGMTDEDSARLAKVGELYRNVADSAISSADASGFVISQMKAFNIQANDAISIIDKVNEVSNNFAVSSSDVATGLTKSSASLAAYGNSLDESISLVTAGAEIMVNQSARVSRGLVSIGANIVKLANGSGKLEFTANGAAKSISLINEQTGEMKNTFEVLKEVSQSWDQMSKAEQSSLALSLAGKTQISVFTSILSNFSTAIEANATALNSSGSAMEENARQADSIKVKINALRAEFEKLVLGDGGLSKFLKLIIDTGTELLKFANSDIGKTITQFGLLFALIKTAPILFTKFTASTLGTKLALDATILSSLGLKDAIAVLTTTMMANPLFLGAVVVGGIVATYTAIDKLIDTSDELTQKTNELKTATEKLQSEYDSLSKRTDLTEAEQNRLNLLQAQIEANKVLAQQEAQKSYKTYTSEQNVATKAYGAKEARLGEKSPTPLTIDTETASVQRMIEAYNDLENTKSTSLDQDNKIKDKKAELISVLSDEAKKLEQYKEDGVSLNEADEDRLNQIYEITGGYTNQAEKLQETQKAQEEYSSMMDLSEEETSDFAKALKMSSDEFIENADAMGLSLSQYAEYATKNQEIQKATDDTNNSIDGLQSALTVATQALDEYSKSGSLTLDTFQSLLAMSPDYLSALINENGQVSINQETLGNLVEQLKVAKIEELQNAAAADILALAHGKTAEMSDTAKKAVSELGDGISTSGDQADTASGKMLGFAASVLSAVNASKGLETGELPDDFEAKQKAIIDSYQKMGDKIANISVDTSKNVADSSKKSSGSSKKAAKDTTDAYKEAYQKQLDDLDHRLSMGEISEEEYYNSLQALNEKYFGVSSGQQQKYLDEYQKNQEKIYKWQQKQQEELLKQQKQTYDKAIDYIKSSLQKKADLLKKDKENELADIDERIDYMEKRRDKELDRIEDKIDALKEEKETFVDGIESQIDALDKLKDKEESDWDARISAYKEQNQLLKEQTDLQKLQEALARAKSTKVKVFKGGEFVYSEDESAINEAQQNLEDYYTELKQQNELDALESAKDSALKLYDEQINSLKDYKEKMSKEYDEQMENLEERKEQIQEYYDSRIEDMKEYRAEVEEEYDSQIETLDNYIQSFDDMVGAYDEKQNRLALLQVAGAEAEKNTWMERLENLRDFVNEYNRLQEELDAGSTDNEVEAHFKGVASVKVGSRATGDSRVKSNEMSLIGDKPNQELIIGGKLNGSLMKLSKGDGVVNAKSTNTLAGILNSLPNIGSKNYSESKQSGSTNSLIIDKVYVQADNAMGFIDSMSKEFKIRFKQNAFAPNPV